jgi:hypothetical protein
MALGLLILVSVGKENIYLSAQPEITFFKIAYRRYTNFSIEPTPQYFKTSPDFGRRCTVNIGKNADLLGITYLYVELPNIQMENISNITKKFAWVNKIGLALINFVEIEIGGTIIDRHYGDWLNIWYEMTVNLGLKRSYNRMIGNIPELTDFTQTKDSIILYIPFSFWFCNDTGLALPLVALLHNDVKIHVEFNDINLCYKVSPSHYIKIDNNYCIYNPGEKIYQNYQNSKNIGEFIYFDAITQQLYYNPIKGTFVIPTIENDPNLSIIGETTKFVTYINTKSIVVQDNDFFKFNPPSLNTAYLLTNYIYLDNFERNKFLNNSHEYLIQTIQNLPQQYVGSLNASYKLDLINPIKLIVWRAILTSNQNNNDQFNYTDNNENLINKNLVVINSVNRMELSSNEYYTLIQKYQYKFINTQKGIFFYSFSLNPLDLQPSGSLNFSKIDDAYIQFSMNRNVNYQNPINIICYAIEYNLLRTLNGIGGLGFNN